MFRPQFWDLGSWVLVAFLVLPVHTRPPQVPNELDRSLPSEEGYPSAVASNALRFESESSPFARPVPKLPSSAADGTENAKDNNAAFPASRFLTNDVRTPENIPLPERTTEDSKSGDASSQVSPSNRERKIEDTLSRLTNTGRHVASHGPDHGSCLIAVIFQAVQVPDDAMEKIEERNPDLHARENDIWQQLLGMMALDFIPSDDDEEEEAEDEAYDEDEEEQYDEDYYDDYYDDYDYDCEEGTECDDDTAGAATDFAVFPFPAMTT